MFRMLDRRFIDVNLFVNKIANAPDDNPTAGTQYIVGSTPTGAFEGATANYIARYDGTAWKFTPPKVGSFEILNVDTGEFLNFNGTAWTAVTSLSGESGENGGLKVVDGIVYGMENSSNILTVSKYTDLGGYPVIAWYRDEYELCYIANINNSRIGTHYSVKDYYDTTGKTYAAFGEGKIYKIIDWQDQSKITSEVMPDNSIFFNKADNSLYVYSETLHKVIRINGNATYTVDDILDYVFTGAYSLPAKYNVKGAKILAIYDSSLTVFQYLSKDGNSGNGDDEVSIDSKDIGKLFVSANNVFSDTANLFTIVRTEYNVAELSTIFDGDTIYNKADGCTYVYSASAKAFVKISEPSTSGGTYNPVAPVLAIIPTGTTLPATAAEGDKFLKTDDAKLYTATAANTWDAGVATSNGDRYASSTDHKIYQSDGTTISASDIALGDIFLNKGDNIIYSYDGTNFISSVEGFSYSPLAPVLNIVATGTTLPATATRGDKFLNTNNAKLYTATGTNLWNSGTNTANGARYASSTDFKIYESNGTTVTASDIALGEMFLNKADNTAYSFDGSAYINIGVTAQSAIETHTLTDDDVTGKSFELQHSIKTGKENEVLLSLSGMLLTAGTDFIALENIISWNGKELDNFGLCSGDIFTVQYLY